MNLTFNYIKRFFWKSRNKEKENTAKYIYLVTSMNTAHCSVPS